jgi:dihydrodipicolinate synthase/N-acetylneuraminate lyase
VAAAFPEAVVALVREPTPPRVALVDALRTALSQHPFQAAVKAGLRHRGVPVRPDVRAPLRPLTDDALERLHGEFERLLAAEAMPRLVGAGG